MIDTWETWKARIGDDPRAEWCDELVARLPPGAHVVELGCGGGTDETRLLAERFRVTGVDLSQAQLRRARERVPSADFVHADLTELELAPGSVDAVAAFYVFNHVPRELLAGLFESIHGWLAPEGLLLATFGASDLPGWTGDWLGAPTYFSGFEPRDEQAAARSRRASSSLRDELVTIREPEGDATFQWILGRA